MKKRIGVISLLLICLTFVSYVYLKDEKKDEKNEDVYLRTVVFQDSEGDLIPISINFHSSVDLEMDVKNRIDLMKSQELLSYGLYPVFSENLEVLSAELNEHVLTLNFNDELYANHNDLQIIEAMTYTMTDDKDIQQLRLQIEGEDISNLPNSQIPLSSLTHDLGLNNFEETSTFLHQTIPVMAYHEKTIHQYSYYVPTTIRIDENEALNKQVQTILSFVENKIHLLNTSLENGVLTIELDSNILLDNERIDKTLEDLIVLSLCTLDNVNDVKIKINDEDVRSQESSQIEYNYVRI